MSRTINIQLPKRTSRTRLNQVLKKLTDLGLKSDYLEKDGVFTVDFIAEDDLSESGVCQIGMLISLQLVKIF